MDIGHKSSDLFCVLKQSLFWIYYKQNVKIWWLILSEYVFNLAF
jgi:hypothetical protein